MKYSVQSKQNISNISKIVELVNLSEQTRNFDESISAFQEIWNDIDTEPDFSEFTPIQQAELYRLSGYFLSRYGKHKNLVNYQERGKNHLTKAIELFTQFGEFRKVAEAQNALSICYYYEGAILEAEAILEQTANDFLENKLDLIYLQNRGNLLMTKLFRKKYDEAIKIIEEIIVPMEFCEDKKACSTFHDTSGRTFKGLKQYKRAIVHYQRAIKYAEEIDNFAFISNTKNNLANLYRITGDFNLAHSNEDEAIRLAQNHNLLGWLPHYLDTKATIYFDEGNFNSALETINEAISIFQKGEDAGGLTEAIWNKCKFLLYLNRKQEAVKLFAELTLLAGDKMGEFAVDNFANELGELIHVKQNGSLDEETRRFRRMEVVSAIRNAKYELKSAAESLKITLADLTQILDKEFPELYEEINIERFSGINNKPDNLIPAVRRNISQLFLPATYSNLAEQIPTFYFAENVMKDVFGFPQDVVMAIEPIQTINADEYVLIYNKSNNLHSFGKVHYDEVFDLYYLLDKNEPIPLSADEADLIGKAAAYIPFSQIDNEKLEFKPLDF
jgi:tetratricopeptide (TPR) repeat protein